APGLLIVAATLGSLAVLAESAIVFDRYAMVLVPGAVLIGGAGAHWIAQRTLGNSARRLQIATALLCAALLIQPVLAVRRASATGSYHEAHAWMLAHLPDGAHVVIYSEDNLYLPRTSEQLSACVADVWTPRAYEEKWATNGVHLADSHVLSMRQ